jgi:methionine-rich copper-binding protein CopC
MASRLLFLMIVCTVVLTMPVGPALAHVELEESDPAAGTTVGSSPSEVFLRFTGSVVADSVTIRVRDPDGSRIDTGPAQSGARAAAVELPSLTRNGRYVVVYDGQSTDGHDFAGRFAFRFRAADKATEVAKTEPAQAPTAPATAPVEAPAPGTPPPADDGAGSWPLTAIAVAVTGALGLGIVLGLLRARR